MTPRSHSEVAILALDLSLTATGWCRDGETGVISTPAHKTSGWERIARIARTVRDLAAGVDLVVIEGYSIGSNTGRVFDRAELGGIVRFWLWGHGLPYVDVPPQTLKKYATGKGNSPKDAMIAAAIRRFGFEGSDNNEADAYLLWCMARHAQGEPVAEVPRVQAESVGKVEWPALAARSEREHQAKGEQ